MRFAPIAVLLLIAVAAPARAESPRMMVLTVGGGARLEAFADKRVSAPLGHHVAVLGRSASQSAVKAAHVRPRPGVAPKDLLPAARHAHASLLLVLTLEHKKLRAALFDVEHANLLATWSERLRGSAPEPETGDRLAAVMQKALPHDVTEKGPAGTAAADDDDDEEADKTPAAGATSVSSNQPAPAEEAVETVEVEAAPAPTSTGPGHPSLRLNVGLAMLQRTASLSAANLALPCYCGTSRDSNPFFAGLAFSGEYYPLAWGTPGTDVLSGLGIFFEGSGSRVNSYISSSAQQVSSTVLNVRTGAAYRFVWWDSPLAPDVTANLGFSYFSFPLPGAAFPSVSYAAPYIGAHVTVPLFTEQFAIVAGGGYAPLLGGTGKQTDIGTAAGGNAFEGRAGVRVAWDMFEVTAQYIYWVYNARYTGAEVQVNGGTSQTNVALTDNINQLNLSFGVRF